MSAELALGCLCGKHMMEFLNEGTCVWCGHGKAREVVEFAYRRNMEGNTVSAIFTTPSPDTRVVSVSRAKGWTWDQDACARAALAEQLRTGRFPSSTRWCRPAEHGEHRPSYATVLKRFGSWGEFKRYCADIPRESIAA